MEHRGVTEYLARGRDPVSDGVHRLILEHEGDSAFGFSGMEVETACRYKLPIVFVIVNNNSIGGGVKALPEDRFSAPPSGYTIDAGYEKMIEGFGGKGYLVRTPEGLVVIPIPERHRNTPDLRSVLLTPDERSRACFDVPSRWRDTASEILL